MKVEQLPYYTCHKTVQAFKITAILPLTAGGAIIDSGASSDINGVPVGQDWLDKHAPVVGGYYVVYADGYTSFSPADAFESGYKLAPVEG